MAGAFDSAFSSAFDIGDDSQGVTALRAQYGVTGMIPPPRVLMYQSRTRTLGEPQIISPAVFQPLSLPTPSRPVVMTDAMAPPRVVAPAVAPIPPADVQPLRRRAFLLVDGVTPIYEVPVVPVVYPPSASEPLILPRPSVMPPAVFEPGGGAIVVPDELIRRVSRWTAEDRMAVMGANPRTVRWTRDNRSAIMPERDDHYI
jgi:ribosomal protein L24E